MRERGISLIALIITIIVIIILAAISIAGVSGMVERSRYAKFCGDLDAVQDAVSQAYGTKRIKEAQDPNGLKNSEEIYKWVATGGDDEKLETAKGPNEQDLYKLADDSVLGLDLPKYGDSGWGVDPKTGEVFLVDGFEYDDHVYYGKADVQSGGKETEKNPGGETGGEEPSEKGELYGKLEVGDYIDYGSCLAEKTYTPDASKTGIANEELTTDRTAIWRVLYKDPNTGEILITPTGRGVNSVKLYGITGYMRGAEELQKICKELYSGGTFGLEARSLTIEDLMKVVPDDSEPYRYAIYPHGATFEAGTEIYNGHEYQKIEAEEGVKTFYINENDPAIDGGGTDIQTDDNRFSI